MTEAERYLEEKLKRERTPAVTNEPVRVPEARGSRKAKATGGQGGGGSGQVGGKVWGVVMGVFAILMAMFWMAVFKGGCR